MNFPTTYRSGLTTAYMDISVVLATYNRASSLKTTLDTFSTQVISSSVTWELLIVDNNSTDSTCDVVSQFARSAQFPVCYIFEKSQGRTYALNAGIAEAKGEIIAFTDDDVLLHSDWLANLTNTFAERDCAAFAGRVLPLWNHPKPEWLEMNGQFAVVNFDLGEEPRFVEIPPLGANCAFHRSMFEKHGLFRVDLGVRGSKHTITCDDTEFGERLIRAKEKIFYCPSALIYHPVDPQRTTKKYFLSWYYYNGVSLRRTFGVQLEGVRWFGVPRWLYREFLENAGQWLITFDPNRRFQHKLKTYRSAGNIAESFRLSKTRNVYAGGYSSAA